MNTCGWKSAGRNLTPHVCDQPFCLLVALEVPFSEQWEVLCIGSVRLRCLRRGEWDPDRRMDVTLFGENDRKGRIILPRSMMRTIGADDRNGAEMRSKRAESSKNTEYVPETSPLLWSVNELRATDPLVSIIELKSPRSWY